MYRLSHGHGLLQFVKWQRMSKLQRICSPPLKKGEVVFELQWFQARQDLYPPPPPDVITPAINQAKDVIFFGWNLRGAAEGRGPLRPAIPVAKYMAFVTKSSFLPSLRLIDKSNVFISSYLVTSKPIMANTLSKLDAST